MKALLFASAQPLKSSRKSLKEEAFDANHDISPAFMMFRMRNMPKHTIAHVDPRPKHPLSTHQAHVDSVTSMKTSASPNSMETSTGPCRRSNVGENLFRKLGQGSKEVLF